MHPERIISEIKNRDENGDSVNCIKEDLGLPKSTVYYHFKKAVGQKHKENALKIPNDEEFKGELCGIFAGDGSYRLTKNGNYKIRFHLNHTEEYWKILEDFLKNKLGKPHFVCDSRETKVELLYNSKKLYKLFDRYLDWGENKTYTIRLRKNFSKDFKRGFARGLIDTDGYRRPDHKRYVFSSASKNLRDDLYEVLNDLHVESQKFEEEPAKEHYGTKFKLRITGNDVNKFNKDINPRKPKRKY